MPLEPRAQTHSFAHSHVAIWRLPSEICMASLKCIERTNRCSEKIGNMPKTTSDNDKLILEHFVVISNDQSSAGEMVNEARSDIIAHRQKPYKIILPTAPALLEHTTQTVYQAG